MVKPKPPPFENMCGGVLKTNGEFSNICQRYVCCVEYSGNISNCKPRPISQALKSRWHKSENEVEVSV
jgi:hypothetical protein